MDPGHTDSNYLIHGDNHRSISLCQVHCQTFPPHYLIEASLSALRRRTVSALGFIHGCILRARMVPGTQAVLNKHQ